MKLRQLMFEMHPDRSKKDFALDDLSQTRR